MPTASEKRARKKKAIKASKEAEAKAQTQADQEEPLVFQGDDAMAMLAQAQKIEEQEQESMRQAREMLGSSAKTDEEMLAEAQAFIDNGGDVAAAVGPEDFAQSLLEHTDAVYSVALHPTNTNIALSGAGDDSAILWDLKSGTSKKTYKDHTDSVIDVGFSFDGKFFATASMDSTIKVYTTKSGKKKKTLEGPSSEINWMRWHSKGYVIAAGSADTTVWLWNARTGGVMCCFGGHIGPVTTGEFTHDGKMLVTGSEDGSLFIWSPRIQGPLHHLKGDTFHMGPINSVATHPTKPLVLTGSYDATACLVNPNSGKVVHKFTSHQDAIESVGFCSVLDICHTASLDGEIKLWDLSGRLRSTVSTQEVVIRCKWHKSLPYLYIASQDKLIRCIDGRSGKVVRIWRGHQAEIYDLQISDSGKQIISGSDDSAVMVWAWDQHSTDWKEEDDEQKEDDAQKEAEKESDKKDQKGEDAASKSKPAPKTSKPAPTTSAQDTAAPAPEAATRQDA